MSLSTTAKLSKRTVDAIKPPPSGFIRVWDTDLKGFYLRVRSSGRKTYELRYRVGRRQKTITIGDHGTFTPEQARVEATDMKRAAVLGGDPLSDRRSLREAATVRELIDRYLVEAPADKPNKRASSWQTDRVNLRRHVEPLLGSKAARDLTPQDLSKWQQDVANGKTARRIKTPAKGDGGISTVTAGACVELVEAARIVGLSPETLTDLRTRGGSPPFQKMRRLIQYQRGGRTVTSQAWRIVYDVEALKIWAAARHRRKDSVVRGGRGCAARAMCSLATMLGWATRTGVIASNPASQVEKLPGGRRERFLTAAEASNLWAQLAAMESSGDLRTDDADLFRLLALTGARRGEILGLRWSEVDWERGLIVLPPDRHKTGSDGRGRVIQLHAQAIDVLRRRQRPVVGRNSGVRRIVPWVFPQADGKQAMHPPKRAWARLCERAGLTGLRMHDLRHTYASLLVLDGVPLAIVGKALGHSKASTTERYAHLKDDATQRASDHVASIYASPMRDKRG